MGRIGNIETLKEEILNQAKEQATIVLDRERRIAERDLNYAKEDAEKIKEQQRLKSQSLAEIEARKYKASAEMEARRILLRKKDELVSRLFDAVEAKLEEMRGSKTYIDIIKHSIKEAIPNIGNKLVVEISKEDEKVFTKSVVSSIESEISQMLGHEIKLDFRVSQDSLPAGVIIKSMDGRMIIDGLFPSLMKQLKDEMRGKISEILLQE